MSRSTILEFVTGELWAVAPRLFWPMLTDAVYQVPTAIDAALLDTPPTVTTTG